MLLRALLLGAVSFAAGVAAAGEIEVKFVNLDQYTDAVLDAREPGKVERELERHFARLAERDLPAGDTLVIEVLDIDLAGRFSMRPGRFVDTRILTGLTWPTMRVRYRLSRDGQLVRAADDTIADPAYLSHGNRYFSDDLLRYEKQMLDDWFDETFAPRRDAAR